MSYLLLNNNLTTVSGNSIQLLGTRAVPLRRLEIYGETVGKKAVFGTATVRIDGVTSLSFTAGATLTFSGFTITANNTAITLSSISGLVMTFPASSFTAATATTGTITDGTNTVNIAVSPDYPQVLTSQTNFDYFASGKNVFLYPYAETTKTSGGITFTNNGDGSITINGTASTTVYFNLLASGNQIPLKKGQYFLSGGVSSNLSLALVNGVGTVRSDPGSGYSFTVVNSETAYAYIRVASGATISNITLYPQLEKSSVKTSWETPVGTKATITLKDNANNQLENRGIPLTYNADGSVATWETRDMIVKRSDGKWYLESNIDILPITTSTSMTMYTGYTNLDFVIMGKPLNFISYDAYLSNVSIFSHGKEFTSASDKAANIGKYNTSAEKPNWRFGVAKGTTVAQAHALLDGSTFLYKRTTPTYTELCAADQNALASVVKTFAGITNISISDSKGIVLVLYYKRSNV